MTQTDHPTAGWTPDPVPDRAVPSGAAGADSDGQPLPVSRWPHACLAAAVLGLLTFSVPVLNWVTVCGAAWGMRMAFLLLHPGVRGRQVDRRVAAAAVVVGALALVAFSVHMAVEHEFVAAGTAPSSLVAEESVVGSLLQAGVGGIGADAAAQR